MEGTNRHGTMFEGGGGAIFNKQKKDSLYENVGWYIGFEAMVGGLIIRGISI